MKPAPLVRVRWVPQEVAWRIACRNPEVDCDECGTSHEPDLCPYLLAGEYADWRTARGPDLSREFQRREREFRCMGQVSAFPVLAVTVEQD